MEKRRLSILGSTGSIGTSTIDVVRHLGGNAVFETVAISGMQNVELLAQQARSLGARIAVTADPACYGALKQALSGSGIEAAAGSDALVEAAGRAADIVVAGIVGMAGLAPTIAAARSGARIALANKECLVSGGRLFMQVVSAAGGELLPVDSEHNAIFQVLDRKQDHAVERIILTASGGPFRDWSLDRMATATPEAAAAHPNWAMGRKISIDSATMFNKALEMIEAMHLFGADGRSIEVLIHPQSVVHSMVGYADGSVLAQLGAPDMRTAIGYAINWPRREHLPVERLDFVKLARLDFQAPDETRFPALRLARRAMADGDLSGAILNGAKEVALEAFIDRRIGLLDIASIVESVMDEMADQVDAHDIDVVFEADGEARARAAVHVGTA